jgi:hypothetical protein
MNPHVHYQADKHIEQKHRWFQLWHEAPSSRVAEILITARTHAAFCLAEDPAGTARRLLRRLDVIANGSDALLAIRDNGQKPDTAPRAVFVAPGAASGLADIGAGFKITPYTTIEIDGLNDRKSVSRETIHLLSHGAQKIDFVVNSVNPSGLLSLQLAAARSETPVIKPHRMGVVQCDARSHGFPVRHDRETQ